MLMTESEDLKDKNKNNNTSKPSVPDYRTNKVRVNIALSKHVLQGAKDADINISSSCEEYLTYLLNVLAWEKRGGMIANINLFRNSAILNEEAITPVSAKMIVELYDSLLYRIQTKLQEYLSSNAKNYPVEIGEIKGPSYSRDGKNTENQINLKGSKLLLIPEGVGYHVNDKYFFFADSPTKSRIRPKDVVWLYDPKVILRNAMIALELAVKTNKEKSDRIKFARDFLEAMFKDSSYKSSESGSEAPSLRRFKGIGRAMKEPTRETIPV